MGTQAVPRHRRSAPWTFWNLPLVGLLMLGVAACQPQTADARAAEQRRPQQAGQAVNPVKLAGRLAGARVAVATGNNKGAEAHIKAVASDITRSARMPDVSRPIDHEAARAAIRPMSGVRSVLWLDASNFVVMVDGQKHRSMAMIDQVCIALEPLGDTLAVVVNLQGAIAKNGDEAETLSRNCQLAVGQRAFMQRKRQVDAGGEGAVQADAAEATVNSVSQKRHSDPVLFCADIF